MGSSCVQMLLPAGDETSRGGAAAPSSDVHLPRDTELIRAQLNPSCPSEFGHGFGQIPLSSNCSCSKGWSSPCCGDCVPFASVGPPLKPRPASHLQLQRRRGEKPRFTRAGSGERLRGFSRPPALGCHEKPPEIWGSLRVLN